MFIPQIEKSNPQDGEVSSLVTMASAAGWYVGHVYYDAEMKGWLPFDRQSHYFATREEADRYRASFAAE